MALNNIKNSNIAHILPQLCFADMCVMSNGTKVLAKCHKIFRSCASGNCRSSLPYSNSSCFGQVCHNFLKPYCDFKTSTVFSSSLDNSEPRTELHKIMNVLRTHGVSDAELREQSNILSVFATYSKVISLTNIASDLSGLVQLLSLPETTLKRASLSAKEDKKLIKDFPSRINYLCHHLGLSPSELADLAVKHTPLLTMDFTRLDTKMKILKDGNISAEDIVKDTWIFNYSEKLLEERVNAAVKAGFLLKPWLIRCPKKHFMKILSRWQETQHILKGIDQVAYLAKRLECTEDYVNYLIEKNVLLPTISVLKLEKIIDFLYEKGYVPEELRLFPKIFCFSVDTLRKRYEKFYSTKGTAPTIPQLSKNVK